MASTRTRLCSNIVREAFGEPVQRICMVLIQRGRMNAPQLCKLLESQSPPCSVRQVMESLVVLIQHNLVQWAEQVDGRAVNFYYSVNLDEIVSRNRVPLFVAYAQQHMGQEAANVLEILFLHGRLTKSRIKALLEESGKAPKNLHRTVDVLLGAAYLKVMTPSDMIPDMEKRLAFIADKVLSENGVTAQKKKKIVASVLGMEAEELGELYQTGMKRRAEDVEPRFAGATKRQKTGVSDDVMLCVNYKGFVVAFRSDMMVDAGTSRINEHAGAVLREILQFCYPRIVQNPNENCSFSVNNILTKLREVPLHAIPLTSHDVYLAEGDPLEKKRSHIRGYLNTMRTDHGLRAVPPVVEQSSSPTGPAPADASTIARKGRGPASGFYAKKSKTAKEKEKEHELDAEKNLPGANTVRLEIHPFPILPFLTSTDSKRDSGTYAIDFASVSEFLKKGLVDVAIGAKYGDVAQKVWRTLGVTGKVEEKGITKRLMLPAELVRTALFSMLKDGYVQCMDISRTNDRTKNWYVWFVDLSSCIAALRNLVTKSMCNFMERLSHESQRNAVLAAKLQRDDVRGDVSLLPEGEQLYWNRWLQQKQALEGAILLLARQELVLSEF